MITQGHPADQIDKACALIESASSTWKEGNVSDLTECKSMLEEALADLRGAEAAAFAQPELLRSSVTRLSQLKIRAAAMERVADIMASFLGGTIPRGPMETPETSLLYRAGGTLNDGAAVAAAGIEA